MPKNTAALELVQNYMDEYQISAADLAAFYKISEPYVSRLLNGKASEKATNTWLDRFISDRGLRWKGEHVVCYTNSGGQQ